MDMMIEKELGEEDENSSNEEEKREMKPEDPK